MARQLQPNLRRFRVSCHGGHLSARPARTGQALSQQLCHPADCRSVPLRGPP